MTHFASADEPSEPATRAQIDRFAGAVQSLDLERSFCNSAGVLAWPEAHAEWIRPGVMLYGVSPLAGRTGQDEGLRPVMTLTTRLIAIKQVPAGEAVGYAGTWRAAADSRIGIAAMGYGDGYPRHAGSGTPVLVDGRPAALAGRVSMDMLAIDLEGHPEAQVGTPVTLWGEGLPVETIAAHAGTIAYELLCGITGRVHVEIVGREPGGLARPGASARDLFAPSTKRCLAPSRRGRVGSFRPEAKSMLHCNVGKLRIGEA